MKIISMVISLKIKNFTITFVYDFYKHDLHTLTRLSAGFFLVHTDEQAFCLHKHFFHSSKRKCTFQYKFLKFLWKVFVTKISKLINMAKRG